MKGDIQVRVLKANELKTFEQLVSLSQEEVRKSMAYFLQQKYGKDNVIVSNKYIVATGDIPIALVAHMDTVFTVPATDVYYDPKKNVLWSPDGLGADDRAGVWAIIQIINSGRRPHIIFTTDEEKGCIGANVLAKYNHPFPELKFLVELDRQGANDCVFYDCYNPAFWEYIESFGFVKAWGTFSDISSLMSAWQICGVNLSVGYEDEHSYTEILKVGHLFDTIEKVKCLLDEDTWPDFEFEKANVNHLRYLSGWDKYGLGVNDWYSDGTYEPCVICSGCGHTHKEYDTFPTKGIDGSTKYFCVDCIDGRVDWCSYCEEPFEIDQENPSTMCHDCVKEFYARGCSKD